MIIVGVMIVLFLMDYAGKRWSKKLKKDKTYFGDRVCITHIENPGIAMGYLKDKKGLIHIITGFALTVLTTTFFALMFRKSGELKKVGAGIALTGAWNNGLERFKNKRVIDYIQFPKISGKIGTICFNLSDFYIIIGGICYLLGEILKSKK